MPQFVQFWRVNIVERAIQHNQVVFNKSEAGTGSIENTIGTVLRLELPNLTDISYYGKPSASMEL